MRPSPSEEPERRAYAAKLADRRGANEINIGTAIACGGLAIVLWISFVNAQF